MFLPECTDIVHLQIPSLSRCWRRCFHNNGDGCLWTSRFVGNCRGGRESGVSQCFPARGGRVSYRPTAMPCAASRCRWETMDSRQPALGALAPERPSWHGGLFCC